MKKIYIVIHSAIIITSVTAQNKETRKADKLYKKFEYVSAIKQYLKLAESQKANTYIYKQLANCYYKTSNVNEASKWYEKAISEEQDIETYFRYAQVLKSIGKYAEATTQMEKFVQLAPNDNRAKAFIQDPNYIRELLEKQETFLVEETSINDKFSDFNPILYNNTLYFTSSRGDSKKKYGWDAQPYLDLYQATYNDDGILSNVKPISELNSNYHDAGITISSDGNTIYFSRESLYDNLFDKKEKIKYGQVNLYKATKINGEWSNIVSLPFNSGSYSTSNPSLSQDGKTLYFSSDMPGGFGETDIWKVSINGHDSYGTPENLGSKVNTEGRESFPFISNDTILYFASDGRPGLGGLDIFMINLNTSEDPENLGKPINSNRDDFSFSFNTEKNVGFFSSNISGIDNIYKVIPICNSNIIITVKDLRTNISLADATVTLLDEKNNIVKTENTDISGNINYLSPCNKLYNIQVSKRDYIDDIFSIKTTKAGDLHLLIKIVPISIKKENPKKIELGKIYFEFNKSEITDQSATTLDKLVALMTQNPSMEILIKVHTDTKGSDTYNNELSEKRAIATLNYIVSKGIAKSRLSAKGYGKSEPIVDCKTNCTEAEDAENRRSEFFITRE